MATESSESREGASPGMRLPHMTSNSAKTRVKRVPGDTPFASSVENQPDGLLPDEKQRLKASADWVRIGAATATTTVVHQQRYQEPTRHIRQLSHNSTTSPKSQALKRYGSQWFKPQACFESRHDYRQAI
ncbi:hypothetical protein F3Y22_tig00000656pilonHSYRG00004 [Hibiscus syriacus]|uniref:Uncharacterized protein n=1 Tax=Hibiscus syriacus TaxID=106335 RepID=A0A6A3CZN6_HIBSY|nr:hypothetical protein F3Y22_tig00000656pilonHSYRG00004 [Hibiscus syriacus]